MSIRSSFQVSNALAPADSRGPLFLPLTLDFSAVSEIDFDLYEEQESGAFSMAQCVYVDNSLNTNPLVLQFLGTNYILRIPAYAGGIFPVFMTGKLQVKATTTLAASLTIPLAFINVPMPLSQWGPITVNVTNSGVVSGAMTDRSGVATGASVQIAAANAARKGFLINNPSVNAHSIYVNFGAAATNNTGVPDSFEIMPGGSFGDGGPVSIGTVNVLGTAGEKFVAKEL